MQMQDAAGNRERHRLRQVRMTSRPFCLEDL
jgi:hypothetical protein